VLDLVSPVSCAEQFVALGTAAAAAVLYCCCKYDFRSAVEAYVKFSVSGAPLMPYPLLDKMSGVRCC
jgi:hypothetical protein